MRRRLGPALLLGSIACCCQPRSDVPQAPEAHPVFMRARNAVFAFGGEQADIQGSAFLLGWGGKRYIVTSFHVVARLENPFVQQRDGTRHRGLTLLAVDRQHDLCVLDGGSLPAHLQGLPLCTTHRTSQRIYLMGFPGMGARELHQNFQSGLISDEKYLAPAFLGEGYIDYIQLTADINLGHSGSPILDEQACVVGVAAWRLDPGVQIHGGNYAVPASPLAALLRSLALRPSRTGPSPHACVDDGQCHWLDICVEGRCRPLLHDGESCSMDEECLLPGRCHDGVCTRPGRSGETCHCDVLCTPPDYCIMGRCQALRRRTQTCEKDQDCLAPLLCIAGRCSRELSRENGPCYHYQHCRSSLGCVEGRCHPTGGRSCAEDDDCSPLYCVAGRCGDLAGAGGSCMKTEDCEVPLVCVSGTCRSGGTDDPRSDRPGSSGQSEAEDRPRGRSPRPSPEARPR